LSGAICGREKTPVPGVQNQAQLVENKRENARFASLKNWPSRAGSAIRFELISAGF
jgi:hypothetical protein